MLLKRLPRLDLLGGANTEKLAVGTEGKGGEGKEEEEEKEDKEEEKKREHEKNHGSYPRALTSSCCIVRRRGQ